MSVNLSTMTGATVAVKLRQVVELEIARAFVNSVLKAGYAVSVNNGEETVLKFSHDSEKILGAMFQTDEDLLILNASTTNGWAQFVYGNDGFDVISDYTTNLEHLMVDAEAVADRAERGDFAISFSDF